MCVHFTVVYKAGTKPATVPALLAVLACSVNFWHSPVKYDKIWRSPVKYDKIWRSHVKYDKIWRSHVMSDGRLGTCLIHVCTLYSSTHIIITHIFNVQQKFLLKNFSNLEFFLPIFPKTSEAQNDQNQILNNKYFQKKGERNTCVFFANIFPNFDEQNFFLAKSQILASHVLP